MRPLIGWLARIRGLFRKQHDFDAELESHLLMHIDDGVRSGLSAEEARRQALLKLGGLASTRELYSDQRGVPYLENIGRDIVYALRSLRKSPGFTATAILSLALGIGANTAIFSLVHSVLLRPLPYPEPDRLIQIGRGITRSHITLAEYELLREHPGGTFLAIAARNGIRDRRFIHSAHDEWRRVATVSPDFFRTLGTPLARGREFTAKDTSRTIILSYDLWRRAFNESETALGQIVTLDGIAHTIVGIAPRSLWLPEDAEMFVPLLRSGGASDLGTNTEVMARLSAGVNRQAAETTLGAVAANFTRQHPDHAVKYTGLTATPYQEWLSGDVRKRLLLLLGAVGLLLLIACANLITLLLARLSARQAEVAVRLALGSSNGRLMQQFVVENMIIAAAGGLAGAIGAYWLLDGLLAVVPFKLPASATIRLDLPVLAFTACAALGSGLLVSLAPVLTFSRMPTRDILKQTNRTSGSSDRLPMRNILIVGEVALAVTLLVSTSLLMHSLYRLSHQPLGFQPDNVLTFFTPPLRSGSERQRAAEAAMLEQFASLPGVHRVAAVNVLPLAGKNNLPAQREGHPEQSIGGMEIRVVTNGYFETMGIPIRSGRPFNATDDQRGAPVVVINEALARQWWPQQSPIGDRVLVGHFRGRAVMPEAARQVVGVVGDTKTIYLTEPARPTLFLPYEQASWYDGGMNWLIQGNLSVGLAEAARRRVRQIEPGQRIERVRTMEQIVASTTATTRFDAILFGGFAAFALIVTAIGVYGLLSFSVARRSAEIGTRMALGATRSDVLQLVLRQGLKLIVAGLVLGAAGALIVTRSLSSLLFEVSSTDPISLHRRHVATAGSGRTGQLPPRTPRHASGSYHRLARDLTSSG